MEIRDRIKELRRVRAGDLVPNEKNWRRHPEHQRSALMGMLQEIGYSDALLVRELPDGKLQTIDGHCRADLTPDVMVPVLVTDLNDQEAKKLLATLDPLAGMAETDGKALSALLAEIETSSPSVQALLEE